MSDQELMGAMHEVLKAFRLVKQRPAPIADGLPVGSLGVLAAIRKREHCHMKELAVEHALDPSTISRAVAGLVRAGLVARVADPADGRASTLHLTEQGNTVLDGTHAHYEQRLAAALHDWTPDEIAAFTASLNRFAHDLIAQENPTPSLEAAR
ncbi:MarR family winged helix-turn-helix transcriptional regulator [Actinoplanes rectilineatus]|uniref:MarR family winged helix-turn-helix transcriptional regulator n=1 Tax=Actinoplanes rectilineatus TaxID=113571 RepID=UPI000696C1C7|nr:MarR family transcriptional regulator [Actinoplanes rectilineatus]